ncbi:MAG: VanZ family protein [Chloroflexi bacterium]|nr:VanZ family protein [Chloroflexota bacterium]
MASMISWAVSQTAGWALLAAIPITVVALVLVVRRRQAGEPHAILRTLSQALFMLVLVAIASLTLLVGPDRDASIELLPIVPLLQQLSDPVSQAVAARNLVGNVLLFIPFGFMAPLAWDRLDSWVRIAVVASTTSACIEAMQFLLRRGFAADVNDVLVNVGGAMLGFAALWVGRGLGRRP